MELTSVDAAEGQSAKTSTRPEPGEPGRDRFPALAAMPREGLAPGQRERVQAWSEPDLLRELLARNNRAWIEFLRRYRPLMLNTIRKITRRFGAVLPNCECEEIFAELMCELQACDMHKLRAFEEHRGPQLGSWLTMLARHATWDRLRCVARQTNTRKAYDACSWSSMPTDPEHALLAKRQAESAFVVFADLSERDRQFIELQYIEQREPAEIALTMKISIKTVYSKKHKLHMRLRELSPRR